MSFIEHMARDDWDSNFRLFFEGTLSSLEEDPFMHLGSAMGDLRAWLTRGGVARLRYMLVDQMQKLSYPEAKQAAILGYLNELVENNRTRLLNLADKSVLPPLSVLGDKSSEVDPEDMMRRLIAGERPFEEWMYGQGYTSSEIQSIYEQVDRCLFENDVFGRPDETLH